MALVQSSATRRRALLRQIRQPVGLTPCLVCLAFPLCLYIAGVMPAVLMSDGAVLMPADGVLISSLALLPMLLIWAVLEEFGWRGYLVTELARNGSGLRASLLVGFVWGLWHAPQIFYSDLPYSGAFREEPFLGALLWIAATTAFGGVLGWLQLTTGSFVLPSIAHALANFVGMLFVTNFYLLWGGIGGIAAILLSVVVTGALFASTPAHIGRHPAQ